MGQNKYIVQKWPQHIQNKCGPSTRTTRTTNIINVARKFNYVHCSNTSKQRRHVSHGHCSHGGCWEELVAPIGCWEEDATTSPT